MINDVVKNFLIKLKVDDKELKGAAKAQENLFKNVAGQNPQQFFNKFDKMIAGMKDVFGKQMPKGIEEAGKAIQKVREAHQKNLMKEIQVLDRELKKYTDAATQAKNDADRVTAKQSASDTFDKMSDKTKEASEYARVNNQARQESRRDQANMVAAMSYAVSQAISAVPKYRQEELAGQGAVLAPLVRERESLYEGDLTPGLMASKNDLDRKAMAYAEKQRKGTLRSDIGSLGSGIIQTGAGLFSAKSGSGGGAAVGLGLAAHGIGQIMGSGGDVARDIFGNRQQEIYANAYNSYRQQQSANSIDPYLMRKFQSGAAGESQFNSAFGIPEISSAGGQTPIGLAIRQSMRSALDPTGQASQSIAMQNRTLFGQNAIGLATGAQNVALGTGNTLQGAAGSLQTMGLLGSGGIGKGEDNIKKIMAEGVARGVQDPGFLQALQDSVTEGMRDSGAVTDPKQLARDVMMSLRSDVPINAQEMEAAKQGSRALQSGFNNPSGLGSQIRIRGAHDIMNQFKELGQGGAGEANLKFLATASEAELLNPESAIMRQIDPSKRKQAQSALRAYINKSEFGQASLFMAPGVRQKIISGKPLTEAERAAAESGAMFSGANGLEGRGIVNALVNRNTLPNSGIKAEDVMQQTEDMYIRNTKRTLGGAATKTLTNQAQMANKADEAQGAIRDNIDSAIQSTQDRSEALDKIGNELVESDEKLKKVLDDFIKAISDASGRIRSQPYRR